MRGCRWHWCRDAEGTAPALGGHPQTGRCPLGWGCLARRELAPCPAHMTKHPCTVAICMAEGSCPDWAADSARRVAALMRACCHPTHIMQDTAKPSVPEPCRVTSAANPDAWTSCGAAAGSAHWQTSSTGRSLFYGCDMHYARMPHGTACVMAGAPAPRALQGCQGQGAPPGRIPGGQRTCHNPSTEQCCQHTPEALPCCLIRQNHHTHKGIRHHMIFQVICIGRNTTNCPYTPGLGVIQDSRLQCHALCILVADGSTGMSSACWDMIVPGGEAAGLDA